MSDWGVEDLRVVSGVNLILSVMKQLAKLKLELETLGEGWKQQGIFNQVTQIKIIIGTAGDKTANNFLVKKINELNSELSWKFRHVGIIRRKTEDALDATFIAFSRHFQNWERVKFDAIIKSLGSYGIIDEPRVLPSSLVPSTEQKQIEYRD